MNGNEQLLPQEHPYHQEGLLRPLEEQDLSLVLGWRNSDRVRAMMYTDAILSEVEHQHWFERLQASQQDALCYIFELHGEPVGVVNFTQFDARRERCTWGFYLGREGLPRGTGTYMGLLALKQAFGKLGILKLCGEVFAFNEASIAYHQRLGFVEEGRFRRHVWKNGKYEDIIYFAKFYNDEWQ